MNKIIVNNNIINSNFDLKINNNKIYIDKDTTIIYLNSNCSYEIYLNIIKIVIQIIYIIF